MERWIEPANGRAARRPHRGAALLLAIWVAMMASFAATAASADEADPALWIWVEPGPHLTGSTYDATVDVWFEPVVDQAEVTITPAFLCEETDGDGLVAIQEPTEFHCQVDVDAFVAAGLDAIEVEVEMFDEGGDLLDVIVTTYDGLDIVVLEERSNDVAGVVTSSEGGPIEGICVEAMLVVYYQELGQQFSAEERTATDEQGAYSTTLSVDAPPGNPDESWVQVTAIECEFQGHWTADTLWHENPAEGESVEIDVELAPLVAVTGTVVDQETASAPAGCVQVYEYRDGQRTSTSARADGSSFLIRTAPGGAHYRIDQCFLDTPQAGDYAAEFPYDPQFFDGASDLAAASLVALEQFVEADLGTIELATQPEDEGSDPGDGDPDEGSDDDADGHGPSTDPGLSLPGGATVTQNGTVPIEACCFEANSPVQVWLFSDPLLLATLTADGEGRLVGEVTVPSEVEPGVHTLELRGTGVDGEPLVLSIELTVVAAPDADDAPLEPIERTSAGSDDEDDDAAEATDELPETGAELTQLVPLGLLALVLGGLLLGSAGATRRRAGA